MLPYLATRIYLPPHVQCSSNQMMGCDGMGCGAMRWMEWSRSLLLMYSPPHQLLTTVHRISSHWYSTVHYKVYRSMFNVVLYTGTYLPRYLFPLLRREGSADPPPSYQRP